MPKHPIPPSAREQRIGARPMRLPFDNQTQRGGWAAWVFRHRIGLLVTVVIYLSLSILFVSYKIVIQPAQQAPIDIEFEQQKKAEQAPPEEQKIEQMEPIAGGRMRNRVSNDNSKFDASLRDNKQTNASKIYEDAQRIADQLKAGREDFNRSMRELEESAYKKPSEPKLSSQSAKKGKNQDAFVSGNVAVAYNLAGRTSNYLDIPAYKCEGGGQVVVIIAVNRNGRVVSASVDRATSTSERCILDEAIASAKASTFNASATAEDPQRGTITYTFVPQ